VIEEISIRDLGVIGEARLPLGPGFTALTGETGAGKTMVVTALGLLLGERADSGAIRAGAGQTVVEGHWEVPESGPVAERVRDAGGDLDAGSDGRASLVLGRSVSSEGRSRASVGGRAAPVGVLNEIGQQLVVVHGQSDQIRLRTATAQREALDRFAGPGFAVLLGDYQEVFRRWQTNQGELDVLVAERDRRAREADDLRQAMDEIEAAAPRRGEDVELAERAERLTNLEDLRLAAVEAQEAVSSQITDGADAVSLIESARRAVERVAGHDPALAPIAESLAGASFALAEISGQISSYLGSLDADSGRELETLQERRAELASLARRYGPTLDDVVDYLDSGSSRLVELDSDAGAEPRPIGKGASGGELSRVMLAIEVVLAGSDPVPTFVFDEVDAGVGGASATEIGRRLARLAETAQVIVVTHLAQVAAFSNNHLVVEKGSDGSVTASSVRLVHAEDRAEEMARLLSGSPDSESAIAHARELLEAAHGRWDH
jgi:DNA repair protein RecN (Recombination protein N)